MPLHTYRGLSIYHQSICLQREDTDSSLEAAPSEAFYTYAEEYDGARSGTIAAQSVTNPGKLRPSRPSTQTAFE